MRYYLMILCFSLVIGSFAQPDVYRPANAHSHNDYEQKEPFHSAYQHGFGSIEADIFLLDGQLYVAHDRKELELKRPLRTMYLEPLLKGLEANHGFPYADTSQHLQMLIDIKTDSIHTLDSLISLLRSFPKLIANKKLHWVITGNRPDASLFTSYPSFIEFDGVLDRNYNAAALTRIALFSDEWRKYSSWYGGGMMSEKDEQQLKAGITKSHAFGKPVRFWAAPDSEVAWKKLQLLGVDYINTDHIPELSSFLLLHPK